MTLRVMIAVTHLLGAGHLARAAALGRAFASRGHRVTLASGGRPAAPIAFDQIDLVQLPPVRVHGTDFKTLRDAGGMPADGAYLAARRDLLLGTLKETRPDVLVTELFPFGRRTLADEFMDLVEEARKMANRPLVVSSVRDILATPTKAGRIEEAHERLERFYDLVLVHGDPDLVPLEASWPVDDRIGPLLRLTGYVDEGPACVPARERRGIVVSGGSSDASLPLYRAAVEAAHEIPDQPWRLLVGGGVSEEAFRGLADRAPAHILVERVRPDFRALLAGAAVSVSQAGYNTVVDLLRAGPASVLVPFEQGKEIEQRLRAERLQRLGIAALLPESQLSAKRLAGAVRDALGRAPPVPGRFAVDGARRSVEIVEDLAAGSPAVVARGLDFAPLEEALRRVRDRGTQPRFWWRDDDAVADTPQLRRLVELARRNGSPVALAVIPAKLHLSLLPVLAENPFAEALVHGWTHANHAPDGAKKAEFGAHRSRTAMDSELRGALQEADAKLGSSLLPVFVPPWNRIAPDLVPSLPRAGYRGLSTFGERSGCEAASGLVQVNTHLDPVAWHSTRGLAEPDQLIGNLTSAVERRAHLEPIGLLTHHLVHDEALWTFCEKLLDRLSRNNVRICPASALFLDESRIVVRP